MFQISFTKKDLVRSVWTFLGVYVATAAADLLGVANDLIESCKSACDFSSAEAQSVAIGLAFLSAVVIGIKNLVLKDGTALKG